MIFKNHESYLNLYLFAPEKIKNSHIIYEKFPKLSVVHCLLGDFKNSFASCAATPKALKTNLRIFVNFGQILKKNFSNL